MNQEPFHQTFLIPGSGQVLHTTRAASGRLLALRAGGRTYVEERDGRRTLYLDGGPIHVAETLLGRTLVRHVRTPRESWLEKYGWDEAERLTTIDGVRITRDEQLRIVGCEDEDGPAWRYRYNDDGPVRIDTPHGRRSLRWENGRLCGRRDANRHLSFAYENDGAVRSDPPPPPAGWQRDELGRVWTILDDGGRVTATFLWDGFACLGRIDGPPGEPLAAAYSLDPTCTPVRVITPAGVTRIPRDAFGEGLLAWSEHPGLYGGLVWQGYTYLPARTADPRSGTFTSPDPYDGLGADPRRAAGFRGALPTEHPEFSPYAISRYDGVGRADPTGNLSFWVYLSDFTWSLQNNLVGWFGLDWVVNFFGSLFTGQIGDFFDYEHLESSSRLGLTGVRRDGVTAPGRVWTFQHLIMSPREEIHDLAQARTVDPRGEFRPTLYGTVLHLDPEGEDPLLLLGTAFANMMGFPGGPVNWSRAGGPAEPVIPGANVPIFPRGGLHFDNVVTRIENPADAVLQELEGGGRSALGTIGRRSVIVIPATGTGLAVDQDVYLNDAAGGAGIFRLLSVTTPNGTTRVRIDSDTPGVGPDGVRLRRLGAADPAEALNQTTEPTHLETQGSARNYRPGNALRLSQGGAVAGARLIDRLEARLSLDEPLPDPFSGPIVLLRATISGAVTGVTRTGDADGLEYPDGAAVPGEGSALLVRGIGQEIPAVVRTVNGRVVHVDRSLLAAGAAGATVRVQPLARGSELGRRSGDREGAAEITYTPPTVRSAPDSGFLWCEDNDGRLAVRRITGRVFDAIVLDQNLPGNQANPYDVERFDVSGFDRDGLAISDEQVLALTEVVDLGGPPALLLQELNGSDLPTAAAGTTSGSWTNGGDRLTQRFGGGTNPPGFPGPAEPLFIEDGSGREVRRVVRIRATVTLDREITVTAGADANLRAVVLTAAGAPTYQARLVGPVAVELAAGHGLAVGDDVDLNFVPGGGTASLAYRVSQVGSGSTLTVVGGPAHSVELTAGGAPLPGTVAGDLRIAAVPQIGVQPVQMPRLRPEAAVEVTWDGVTAPLAVAAVDGNRVTLTQRGGSAGVTDLYLKTVTLRQFAPADPGNGSGWRGIRGEASGGAAAGSGQTRTGQLTFDLWAPNDLTKGTLIGVADGERTLPCRVLNPSDLDVTIFLDRGVDTAVDPLTILDASVNQTGFALDFVREDRALVIRDIPPLLNPTGNNLVWVTPMVPAAEESRRAGSARVNPGTVLVPEDPENWELDRRQSLIDHELIHTRQSAAWGPLLLAWFPLFALEGLYEGVTDIEEPDYSPYVAAVLSSEGNTRFLTIPDPAGISFSRDDQVQLAANGQVRTIRLGNENGDGSNRFAVTLGAEISDQNLSVRKILNDGGWAAFRDVMFNIQQVLTHGGVLNTLTGSIYGGFFHGMGRLFYALGRAIFGKGDRFGATVVESDKTALTLADAAGAAALQGANRITIQKDDATYVRALSSPASGQTLTLAAALDLTGEVFVAPYSTHTPDSAWDWNSYYPAQVPDPAQPAAIRLLPAGDGDTLTLSLFDRVVVTSGTNSRRTNVTHVRGDGIVELEDAPTTSGDQRDFRIAKIDEGDPMGNVDSIAIRELGMGWMRWLFDPYGQFQYRLQPDNDSFWGILARIARYLFGSTSWSLIFPFGYYFWDNAFVQSGGNGHFSQMEQEASQESGDLYSPIGRLRGAFTKDNDTGRYRGVVGDIGRYWYFHVARNFSLLNPSGRDTPGINWLDISLNTTIDEGLRIIPDWTGGAGTSDDPNQDAQAGGDTPGLVAPDLFFRKSAVAPLTTTAADPTGFAPAAAGYVPVSANLERSFGMYVSFCRPGQHRVTVANGVTSGQDAFDAQEGSSTFGFGRQTIYFNVDVADVGVTVGGRPVANTLTDSGGGVFVPETIELVQLQRARVDVTPNGARRYALTVPYDGVGGYLRTGDGRELIAMNRNTPANEPEPVEISRVYRRGADGSYDDAVLNAHGGVHLQGDVHVPVRQLRVRVVDTLPVRRAATLEAGEVLDPNAADGRLRPGDEAFVIIPADPTGTLRRSGVTYPSAPALVTNPQPPQITAVDTPAGLQGFVGDGVISRIFLQPDNPPEAAARMTFTVEVGFESLRATLTAEIEVVPRLTLAPAAGLTIPAAGGTLDFTARDEGGAAVAVKEDTIRLLEADGSPAAGLSAAVSGTTITVTAAAGVTTGRKQILVERDSDANHWARRTFEVV